MAETQADIDAAQLKARNAALQSKQAGNFAQAYDASQQAARAGADAGNEIQAKAAGVNTSKQTTNAGGIGGFFGAEKDTNQYTAQNVGDTTTDSNKLNLNYMIDNLRNRPNQTMAGPQSVTVAQVTGANINTVPQDEARWRQVAMLDSLRNAAEGNGESAANATLQSSTDRNLAASLASAAASGGSPAAYRKAAFDRAQISQDAAAQSAALRANEISTARSQGVAAAEGLRGQDMSLASGQAGLTQQARLANQAAANANTSQNTQLTQDAAKTNLLSGVEQQAQRDQLIQQLQTQDFTLDEAQRQADIQQKQFNASLLAQQEAAKNGVSASNSASAGQAGASVIGAIASTAAAASDERVKKKVEDGDTSTERMLDAMGEQKTAATQAAPAEKTVGDRFAAAGKALGKSMSGGMGGGSSAGAAISDKATARLEGMTDAAAARARKPYAVSDKGAKKNVEDGGDHVQAFLDSLAAKDYDYKDPGKHGEGRRTGVMAQDVESTPMGKPIVMERDGVKMLDLNKATSAALASLANINKRLRALEA